MPVVTPTVRRFVVLALSTLAALVVVWLVTWSWIDNGRLAWDASTYLAAGERLNAGHPLYELSPGDRWVWIDPPYWTVPLLYPPPIAVVWRPLAALPSELGVGLWAVADAVLMLLAAGWIVWRVGPPAALLALILSPAIAWEVGVSNVHGFILAALVLVWERPRAGAVAIGVLTAIKLTPAVILVWLAATGRTRAAVVGSLVALAVFVASVAIVGTGQLDAYVAAARIAEPSVLSIPGLLATLGIGMPTARAVGWFAAVFGAIEVFALRRSRLAWPVAVATMVLGSPVVNVPTFSVLLACPLALTSERACAPRPSRALPTAGATTVSDRSA